MTPARQAALACALALAGLILMCVRDSLGFIAIGYAWLLLLTLEKA